MAKDQAREQAAVAIARGSLVKAGIDIPHGQSPIAVFLQTAFDEMRQSMPSERAVGTGREHYTSSWVTGAFVDDAKALLGSIQDAGRREQVMGVFAANIQAVLNTSRTTAGGRSSEDEPVKDVITWLAGGGAKSFHFTRERGRVGMGAEAMDLSIFMIGMVQDPTAKKNLLDDLAQKICGRKDHVGCLRSICGASSLTETGSCNLKHLAALIIAVDSEKQSGVTQLFAEKELSVGLPSASPFSAYSVSETSRSSFVSRTASTGSRGFSLAS